VVVGVAAPDRSRRALSRLDTLRDQLSVPALRRRATTLGRRIGLTRTGQVALVGAVVPWVAARVVAGTTLYILAYGVIAVVLTATFLAPRRLRLVAERTGLFPRAQQGDRLEVTIDIVAQKSLSSFHVEEQVPEQLGSSLRMPVSRVSPSQGFSYTYSLQCTRRGAYTIGPLVAITQDPIGVSQRQTVLAEPFELLVHPRVARVSDRPLTRLYEDPPIRPPVSKPWPSGMEFYGMREYRGGDDLRRIVWRASARTGRLMVSEAEQGITDHITIVLDTDRGSHTRDGEVSESFEYAVSAAASLGVRHLAEGYEVRVEANAGPLTRSMRGPNRSTLFLDVMARVDSDRVPLATALRRLVNDPRRDAHTVVITPRLSPTDAALLKLLVDKGVSVTVVGLVTDELEGDTFGSAAALGCQVTPVRVGEDLAAALTHELRTGGRR
jgi:uncharacterized protein (DUF58 family)